MATPDSETAVDEAAAEEKPKLALEVTIDKPSACQRHITVTVSRADIDRYFEDAFDELQPKAEVPGFRPGRAPRKLVESRFREQMSDQVKGSLLMDSVTQVTEEQDFSAISEPDFDFEAVELPEEGPLTFEFNIEVRPEFDLPEWRGLKLERPEHEYSDDEVDRHLKNLLARYGRTTEKTTAEAGDQVTINIVFKDGDELVAELAEERVGIKPTLSFRDAKVEGFDKLLIGAKAGDRRKTTVTISEHADNESLRGKQLDAEIEVRAVRGVALPELTPVFLDEIGGFEDQEELREAVREELEKQLTYHQQQRIRQQITGLLTQSADWELPPDLLRRQARRELERHVLELRSHGFGDDVIRAHQNELRQNILSSTERSLKEHFIFERLAEEHEIDAEPHDFDTEIRLIAAQSQDAPRRIRARLEKRGQMDVLRNQIIERKVVDLITAEAEFREVPFDPVRDETVAVDWAISGQHEEAEIPEAKYGDEAAEELPGQKNVTG